MMRRRLAAFLVVAVTVVVSVVGGATPAFAEFSPVCISDPGVIVCRVPPTAGLEVTSTAWAVNGANVSEFRNSREISILCTAGSRTSVQLTLGFSNGTSTVGLTPNILCVGRPLANVSASCSSGGGQMRCFVSYEGGTPPITVRWTINGDERSLFNDRISILTRCQQVPSIVSISVTVRDAVGAQQTVGGDCFCHSGPWD